MMGYVLIVLDHREGYLGTFSSIDTLEDFVYSARFRRDANVMGEITRRESTGMHGAIYDYAYKTNIGISRDEIVTTTMRAYPSVVDHMLKFVREQSG